MNERMEYAIFRRSDGNSGVPVDSLRYTKRAAAERTILKSYANPTIWEVRGRVVGAWSK